MKVVEAELEKRESETCIVPLPPTLPKKRDALPGESTTTPSLRGRESTAIIYLKPNPKPKKQCKTVKVKKPFCQFPGPDGHCWEHVKQCKRTESETEVEEVVERDALAGEFPCLLFLVLFVIPPSFSPYQRHHHNTEPSPWPPGCKAVKVRLPNCNQAKNKNCFVGSVCCGSGCNSKDIVGNLNSKPKKGPHPLKHDALPEPVAEAKKKPKHHDPSHYPDCGAPICKLRRAIFGKRTALPVPEPEPEPQYTVNFAGVEEEGYKSYHKHKGHGRPPGEEKRDALAEPKKKKKKPKHHDPSHYPDCGAPICKLRLRVMALVNGQ
ncbi:MAG: hypothetical protein Q9181_006317 [Wetmoreana brouardii]